MSPLALTEGPWPVQLFNQEHFLVPRPGGLFHPGEREPPETVLLGWLSEPGYPLCGSAPPGVEPVPRPITSLWGQIFPAPK